MRSALLVLTFALVAVPARAQSADSRWQPWLGCWMLATENLRDGATQDPRRAARPSSADANGPRVCVTPTDDGARFETTVGGQSSSDQTIIADGATRPVSDAECTGTKRSQWSKTGFRLYSASDVRCEGEAEQRRVSGLSLLTPTGDWLDIQTVALGGRETISVKRYYRDTTSPRPAFQSVAASVFTLDDVKDAAGKVSTAAIEAALVETGAGFNLTAKNLKDLNSAGVPERIIDLVVALSYPEKFVVQRAVHAAPPIYRDPFGPGWSYGYPYYYDRYYGSPYFYEPFGWRGYSVFESSVIFVESVGGGSGGSVPNGPGRAVNGLGYTRITNRESFPTASATANPSSTSGSSSSSSSGSSGGATASSSGGYSSGGGSSSSSSGSSGGGSGSSGGGSSSSGSSSSGDSGGRTAVPR